MKAGLRILLLALSTLRLLALPSGPCGRAADAPPPRVAGESQAGVTAPPASARPNIVFLLADDLGYGDLGCYGGTSFAHVAGVSAPPDRSFDGVDLVTWLAARQPAIPRTLFWRGRRGNNTWWAVRDGDLKYVRRAQGGDVKEWFFDLTGNVAERNNLFAARPADRERLKSRLAQWENEVRPGR